MTNLSSNPPFCSNDLVISSERKNSKWLVYLSVSSQCAVKLKNPVMTKHYKSHIKFRYKKSGCHWRLFAKILALRVLMVLPNKISHLNWWAAFIFSMHHKCILLSNQKKYLWYEVLFWYYILQRWHDTSLKTLYVSMYVVCTTYVLLLQLNSYWAVLLILLGPKSWQTAFIRPFLTSVLGEAWIQKVDARLMVHF